MILKCVSEAERSALDDTYLLNPRYLQYKAAHLFIASNSWEEALIEVCSAIPKGSLTWLSMVCKNIKVRVPDEVDAHILGLLIELYPDKAGLLRKAFMQGTSVKEVLGECVDR